MRIFILAVGGWMAVIGRCLAAPALLPPVVGGLCAPAIAVAEHAIGIPHDLLAAIGRVETGRRDPVTGLLVSWPWSVDIDGQGAFYDTRGQAIAAVKAAQARGVQSIDVGCLQVNLLHHPDAFPSLEAAFTPSINAMYAGEFLSRLFAQTGSWSKAAAMYHSATPSLGLPYEARVLATWNHPSAPLDQGGGQASPQPGWAATPFPLMVTTAQARGFLPPRRAIAGVLVSTGTVLRQSGAAVGHSLKYYRSAPVLAATHFTVRIGH